jgi:hypothetical protein
MAEQQTMPDTAQSFFESELVSDVSYFEDMPVVKPPKPSKRAAEAGLMGSIVTNNGLYQGITEDVEAVRRDLETNGESPEYSRAVAQEVQSYGDELRNSTTVPEIIDPILDSGDPKQARTLVEDINQEEVSVKVSDPRALMVSTAMEQLSPAQREIAADFSSVYDETLYSQAADQVLNEGLTDAVEKADFLDWAGALINPAQPLTSRADQKEVGAFLAEELGEDFSLKDYVFKSDHVQLFDKYLTDPDLTVDQLNDRLDSLKGFISTLNERDDVNPVYTMELLDWAQYQLENARAPEGAKVTDALELGLPLAGFASALRGIGKWAGLKMFGRAAKASGQLTTEQAREISKQIRAAISEAHPEKPRLKVGTDGLPRPGAGSLADALNNGNPLIFRKMLSSSLKKDPDSGLYFGVTKEDLAQRIVPDPRSKQKGMHRNVLTGSKANREGVSEYDTLYDSESRQNFNKEFSDTNAIDLLTPAERQKVVSLETEAIARRSRGTLHAADTEVLDEDDGDLIVQALFGESVDGGYRTSTDAKKAAKFLFGEVYRIVAKPKGVQGELVDASELTDTDGYEFFVQSQMRMTPSGREADVFNDNIFTPKVPLPSYLVPWSKRLSKDLFDGISAFTDKGNRLTGLMSEMLEPVLKLNDWNKADWTRLLMHGDEHGMEFTRAQAKDFLGKEIPNNLWKAYTGTRNYYNTLADIRQKSVYTTLKPLGFRSAYGKGGILQDMNKDPVHLRPLTDPKNVGNRPTEPKLDLEQVWGKKVYDLRTNEVIDLNDDLLGRIKDGGDVTIARTSRPAEFISGEEFDFVLVKASDLKPLRRRPMNVRTGHVDRNYKGEDTAFTQFVDKVFGGKAHKGGTGWRISKNVTRNIGGEDIPDQRVVGLTADKQQADDLAFDLDQEAMAKLEPGQEYVSPYRVERTREASFELGLDNAGTFSNLPAHSRKRGEQVLGPSGFAEVESIEDSLSKSVGEIRRTLAQPILDIQRSRFMQTYGDFMENASDGFQPLWDQIQWKSQVSGAVIDDAMQYHKSIVNFANSVTGKERARFMQKLAVYADGLREKQGLFDRALGKGIRDVVDTQLGNSVQQITATFFIAARPLFQVLANSFQSAYLFVQNPARFTAQTLPRALVTAIGLNANRLKLGSKSMDALAKAFGTVSGDIGMTGKQFEDYLQGMRQSGMFSTKVADDIFSVLTEGQAIEAGRHSVGSRAFWKRMIPAPGTGALDRAGRVAMIPQRMSTDLTNFMAYTHAANRVIGERGIAGLGTKAGKNAVVADARRLTFNQNRADQFTYQQNLLGIQLQFIQHVHRMWNDMIADPTLRLLSGNKLKLSEDGTNLYAQGWAQSFSTLAGLGGMFGVEWMLPDETEGNIRTWAEERGVNREIISAVMDGYVGLALESMFGEKIQSEDRLSPIGMATTTFDMMFTNDGGLALGGPAGSLWEMGENVARIGRSYLSPQGLSYNEATKMMQRAVPKMFAGARDFEKAMIAMNLSEYRDSNGRKIADVDDDSWIPILFSMAPEKVNDYYDSLDDVYAQRDLIDTIAKEVNSYVLTELSSIPADELRTDKLLDMYDEGMQLASAMADKNPGIQEEVRKQLLTLSMNPGEGFLAQHIDKIVRFTPIPKAVLHLERLKEKYPNAENFIQEQIDDLKQQHDKFPDRRD